MVPGIAHTVRKRLTVRHVLAMVAFLAIFYGVTRDADMLVAVALALGLGETVEILRDTPSIDNRWVHAGLGTFVAVGSLAWVGYELTIAATSRGPAWFPGLTFLAGVWILLDARRDFLEEPEHESSPELGTSKMMLILNHAHLVVDELKGGPKTVPELAEECDLTESRIRDVLEFATDDGMIYRVGGAECSPDRYALDESKVGGVAFVRSNGKRILRRFARPFHR